MNDLIIAPKLWGEWEVMLFADGASIVVLKHLPDPLCEKPHLFVFPDSTEDEDRRQADRYVMCDEIRNYLNNKGNRPEWLDEFDRVTETFAECLTGAFIQSVGPYTNTATDDWEEVPGYENARAKLMDALFL